MLSFQGVIKTFSELFRQRQVTNEYENNYKYLAVYIWSYYFGLSDSNFLNSVNFSNPRPFECS